jgi:glycine/D-amino acid oxidase-like deaminating enzyme
MSFEADALPLHRMRRPAPQPARAFALRRAVHKDAMRSESLKSLWWHTAVPPPETDRLQERMVVDIAIVGGGFTGLTAALHLVERGKAVAVFEAAHLGAGASGLNAGFVVPNFAKADPAGVLKRLGEEKGRALLDLVSRGGGRVFETVRTFNIECDAAQTGWLQPAHSAAAADAARARAEFWRSLGRPTEYIDGDEVRRLTGMTRYRGALLDGSGGTIQPLSYLRGLARAAIENGVQVYEFSPVHDARRHGPAWRLMCNGSSVEAETVLLCTSAGREGLARRLSRSIVPLPVYQIATEPVASETVARIAPARIPVSDMRGNLFTYRLDRDDRLISGGMALLPIGAHDRLGRAIAKRLARELALPDVPRVECVWRGVAAMTPDFLPHLYEIGPRFIGAVGCNGRGVAMTAMLGEVLAEAATGTALDALPVPVAPPKAIPARPFAGLVTSAAVAAARLRDWREGAT